MTPNRVLLVGWDAADWKLLKPLIDRRELPVFGKIVERGVISDMATLEPVLSPMLWNSIATGKRADQHGILGFTEVDRTSGKVRPVASTSRRTKALWNILSQNGFRTNVAGWFASHPAEPIRGACVSDAFARAVPARGKSWPTLPGTVYPESLAPILEQLRVRPEEIDREIFRLFIPRLAEIDRSKPNGLDMLAKILAECFTTHAAATWLMENTEWDFMAAYYIGIDHFSHGFMNFHPPRVDWIEEKDFEIYRDVVNGGYRLMDLFLGRLLQLAGPDTTVLVISDHGFHSDRLRPRAIPDVPAGPATQHRRLGIFAMAGDGVRADELIYGVSLLDVAPTVLSLFGLPAGEDMPGRVLAEAFEKIPVLARISSWDAVGGEDGMLPPGILDGDSGPVLSEESDAANLALIEQFVALGYLDPQTPAPEQAASNCERETKWNLARVYASSFRYAKALPLLEDLHAESPARPDFALTLADTQLRLGLLDEAKATAAGAIGENHESAIAHIVHGRIAFEQRRYRESMEHLLKAEKSGSQSPELWTRLGSVYLKLRRWNDARRAFETALSTDPQDPFAHQGLTHVLLRLNQPEEAVESALSSAACRYDLPLTHFLLGLALLRSGRRDGAIQALQTSLSFHPPLRISHRVLASIYGKTEEGERHRDSARRHRRAENEGRKGLEQIREEARNRAIARDAGSRARSSAALTLTVVSGLPRSGTSLMMHILSAGGIPPMTDGVRTADRNNPEGYFEWEAVRKIGAQPEMLLEAAGKAIKVVSILLPSLPLCHRYKVLFMDRPLAEVLSSQREMIQHRGGMTPAASQEELERMLQVHRDQTLRGLLSSPAFDVLVVDYPSLVRAPEEWLPRIQAFLGCRLDAEAMRKAIRPELYRNAAG
jgi:predicted AlkP superfamily phosphohydrolase/phosphomutase/tetratricopeptide (TPR) repeat protein